VFGRQHARGAFYHPVKVVLRQFEPLVLNGANDEPAFQQFLNDLLARDRVVRRVTVRLRVAAELSVIFDGVFRKQNGPFSCLISFDST